MSRKPEPARVKRVATEPTVPAATIHVPTVEGAFAATAAAARQVADILSALSMRDDDDPAATATARFRGLASASSRPTPAPGRAAAVAATLETMFASALPCLATLDLGSRRAEVEAAAAAVGAALGAAALAARRRDGDDRGHDGPRPVTFP